MNYLNEEERYLAAHISDLAALSRKTGVPRFSRYLSEREMIVALAAARTDKANPIFYGGYDGAARTVCGFFEGTYAEDQPPEQLTNELFPLCAVTFSFRKGESLSHRDFLGAILGLGLDRSGVGDILVADDHAVVFCLDSVQRTVLELEKVGRAGVKPQPGITKELPSARFEIIDRTVPSMRLDCIVGACTGISRDKSASLVKGGQVSADFSVCLNVSGIVKEGSVISIRGFGRFRLSKIVGETKKCRIRVIIEKYL